MKGMSPLINPFTRLGLLTLSVLLFSEPQTRPLATDFEQEALVPPVTAARFIPGGVSRPSSVHLARLASAILNPDDRRYVEEWNTFFNVARRGSPGQDQTGPRMQDADVRRLVFLSPHGTRTGGVATYLRTAIQSLLLHHTGLTVELIVLHAGEKAFRVRFQDRSRDNRLVLRGLPEVPDAGPQKLIQELEAMAAQGAIGLFAANSSTPHFAWLSAAQDFARKRGIPFHYYFHGGPILEGTRSLIRNADHAATNSVAMEQTFHDLGLTVKAVHPVGDMTLFSAPLSDEEARSMEQLRDAHELRDQFVILHPGRIAPLKGQEDTLRAAGILHKLNPPLARKTTFVLVGPERTPGEAARLASLAQRMGVRLVRIDRQSSASLRVWYRIADVVVYPTRTQEPFGLVPLEAQAAGTPVIVSDTGGLPETLLNQVTGLMVPPGDARALAGAIESLLADTTLRKRMSAEAVRHIQNRYSPTRTSRDLVTSLLKAVHARQQPGPRVSLRSPRDPLRILYDGYERVYQPGERLRLHQRPSPSDLRLPGGRMDRLKRAWLQQTPRAVDPSALRIRPLGPFVAVEMGAPSQSAAWSVTRDVAKVLPGDHVYLPLKKEQLLEEDPFDPSFVVRINDFPKMRFHSLLISREWQPQKLIEAAVQAQLRWVHEGAVSEFHRPERFVDHLHVHLLPEESAPIARFSSRFISEEQRGPLQMGRLSYPMANFAIASGDDHALARAIVNTADLLDDAGVWFYESVLQSADRTLRVAVFTLLKWSPLGISFGGLGIVKVPHLEMDDARIWADLRRSVVRGEALRRYRNGVFSGISDSFTIPLRRAA